MQIAELPPTYLAGYHDKELVSKMRYSRLGETDLIVSQVGFGGCVVGGVYPDKGDLEEIYQCVETGIKSGINFIDTSPFYGEGKSEEVLGQALRRIPRHCYYIATKVGRYSADWTKAFDFTEERVLKEFDNSLARLQLPSVDILHVHDFEYCQSPQYIATTTLPAVLKIVQSGRAKYIGITGYPLEEFKKVLELTPVKVNVVLSYSRNTLIDLTLKEYVPYFESKHLGVINASPTAMGLLTNRGPPVWHPASPSLKKLCSEAGEYCAKQGVELGKLSVHHNLVKDYGGTVASTLLGVGTMEILKINLDIVFNGLTEHEEEVLQNVKEKYFKNLCKTAWDTGIWNLDEYNKMIKN